MAKSKELYLVREAGENVLDVGLNNGNPLVHPSPALINAGRVEYFHVEDTKYGLVTWTSLGRAIGVQTSTMDTVIHLISTLHQKDYFAMGERTLERFGLAGLTVDELNHFLETGSMPNPYRA